MFGPIRRALGLYTRGELAAAATDLPASTGLVVTACMDIARTESQRAVYYAAALAHNVFDEPHVTGRAGEVERDAIDWLNNTVGRGSGEVLSSSELVEWMRRQPTRAMDVSDAQVERLFAAVLDTFPAGSVAGAHA